MKKLLVLAALTMAAAPAMASKARLSSLGNASHLVDTQTMFVNPADMNLVGDMATLEFGNNTDAYTATTATAPANPKAEGGFTKTLSWGKVGAYLGHRNDATSNFISQFNATQALGNQVLLEQNPLDLFYGADMAGLKWGFDLHYSNAKKELSASTEQKVNTLGLSFGVRADLWDAYARIGLNGKSENSTATATEVKSDGYFKVAGGYWFDSIYAFANVTNAKATMTGGTKGTVMDYEVGMVNNHKVEGGNFFYGISYLSTSAKTEATAGSADDTKSALPLIMGLEVDATSWMTLRGSVKQAVLLRDVKDETIGGTTLKSQMLNDTEVAAGLGLKFGKITVDGSVAAATTGKISSVDMLTNASLTYMF